MVAALRDGRVAWGVVSINLDLSYLDLVGEGNKDAFKVST